MGGLAPQWVKINIFSLISLKKILPFSLKYLRHLPMKENIFNFDETFFANFYPLWSDEMMISKRWINFNAKGGLANASLSFPFPYLWRYQVSRVSKRRENEWQIKMQAESSLSSHPNAAHESTAEKCKDENPKVKLFCHEKKRARAQTKKSAMLIFSPQSNRWRDLNCCQSENANEFDPSGEITFYNEERGNRIE